MKLTHDNVQSTADEIAVGFITEYTSEPLDEKAHRDLVNRIAGLVESTQDEIFTVQQTIKLLDDALAMLDILGQIQSAVGGLSMGHRAQQTFNTHAKLEAYRNKLYAELQERYKGR